MVYPDPDKDLTFYGIHTENEDRSRLNQPLEFLLDPKGNKIVAADFFFRQFRHEKFPQNYEGGYEPPTISEDIYSDDFYCPDGRIITVAQWLKKKKVRVEQLCLWPCYAADEAEYATILKKYRLFEYNGCLWHHLGMLLKRSEILGQFSDTWYYTDIHAYERALRIATCGTFWKKQKYQRQLKRVGYFAAHHFNSSYVKEGMFEVFFDQKIS